MKIKKKLREKHNFKDGDDTGQSLPFGDNTVFLRF